MTQNDTQKVKRGHAVLAVRESRGWSLEECAQATGFTVARIMKWENAKFGISINSLNKLASGYAMTDHEVMSIVMAQANYSSEEAA